MRFSLGRSNTAEQVDALVTRSRARWRTSAESPYMPEAPIAVAMSGGVDSSTVAALLVRQGHPVVGLTMQLLEPAALAGAFHGRRDGALLLTRRRVRRPPRAEQIGIPYYVVNFERQFEEQVVKPFVEEYLAGRTPIPCTLCNNFIKFDRFLEMAESVGASPNGHRPLRAHPPRRSVGPVPIAARGGRFQGPDLLPVRPHPGATLPHHVSAGRDDQARKSASWPAP